MSSRVKTNSKVNTKISTKINTGLSDTDRKKIGLGLSKLLADSYTLYLKTHGFHWNVTGPNFKTLHLLFEEQYTELALAIDTIAERIRALDLPAPASYQQYAKLTALKEETGIPADLEMIKQLIADHEHLVKTARELFIIASKVNDEVTTSLLSDRMSIHEKTAWMLRSSL